MNTTTIKTLRKKTGMTQAQFAKKLRMSAAWVGAVECGRIAKLSPKVRAKVKKFKAKRLA